MKMNMRRRELLLGGVGCLGSAAYPCYWEPRWFEVTRREVRLESLARPVRLLHLADLHASVFVPLRTIEQAITLGLETGPDLICVTGDFITHRGGFDAARYEAVLKRLSRAAPTFAVLGNHDGGAWAARDFGYADSLRGRTLLGRAGIQLLHNRSVDAGGLTLIGVGDLWAGEIDAPAAFADVRATGPRILLSHNPDSKDVLRDYPWDIMLSGHTHGGQVIVPFRGPCYAPVQDKRYVAGLKPWRDRQIHVTRGVGNVGGVRFRCRPDGEFAPIKPQMNAN